MRKNKKTILKIKDHKGNSVINYFEKSDFNKLKLFLKKNFSTIKGNPIRLTGEVGIVSYFLARIILISGLQLNVVEQLRMFKINGIDFFSKSASTEKYRISFRNESVMIQIDRLILAQAI